MPVCYYIGMKKTSIVTFMMVAFTLTAAASQLPFSDTFETSSLSNNWITSGTAQIQTNVFNTGSKALEIKSGSVNHSVSNGVSSIWLNFFARCNAAPASAPAVSNSNTSVAFYVNTNLNLVVYNYTNKIELTSTRIKTNVWTRFDLFCDYNNTTNPTWSICVNGTNAANGLSFYSNNSQIESILIANDSSTSVYIDDLNMVVEEPVTGLVDTDNDGIPDWWEQKYFGGITAALTNALAKNGLTLLQSYTAGLDPENANDQLKMSLMNPRKFNWDRKLARKYDIFWASALNNSFVIISTNIAGNYFEDADTNRTQKATGFYQVRVRR